MLHLDSRPLLPLKSQFCPNTSLPRVASHVRDNGSDASELGGWKAVKSQSRRLTDPKAAERRGREIGNGPELTGGDDRAQLLSLADHRADAQDRDFGQAPCRRSPDSPPIPLAVEALRRDPLRVRVCPPVARFGFGLNQFG